LADLSCSWFLLKLAASNESRNKKGKNMVSKEAIKLYKHLVPQGSLLVVGEDFSEIIEAVGAAHKRVGAFESLGVAQSVDLLHTLSASAEQQTFDTILVVLDQAQVGDIQTFLADIKPYCTTSTRVMLDFPAPWWRSLPNALTPQALSKLAQSALSISDMQRIMVLADYERVAAGTYELLPWSIPVVSWIFNSFLARVPLVAALCRRRWLVMRPLVAQKVQDVTEPVTAVPAKAVPAKAVPVTTVSVTTVPVVTVPVVTVSVIIPCRNERGNIEAAVLRTPIMGAKTEIIFVEGHSKDDTIGEIKRVAAAYPDRNISWCVQPGKGKGDAVRAGFAAATGDVLMILDADLTVQPEELPKFFYAIAENKGECINGSRLVYPMEDEAMQTLNWWANHFFANLFSWLMGQRVTDTLCGTKVLWRKDYERIAANRAFFGEFDPFGDFDLLFGAAKLQLKILDVPVHYKNRVYGSTQIRRFVHGWILLGMSLYAMRKLKFY